jgi:putative spermidine/putrescine transport system substrate-binding protein
MLTRRGFIKAGIAGAASAGLLRDAALTFGAAPAVDAGTAATVRIMVWSGLVQPIVADFAVKPFQTKYPKVTIQQQVGTNAEFYPKLLATRSKPQFAGAMMNDLFEARGALDGLWQKIDLSLLPNAAKVPAKLNPPDGYAIALMLTPYGIAYNPEKVGTPPTSWTDLYKPEYKGRVVMMDGFFGAFQMAALIDGHKDMDVTTGIKIWEKYKDNIGAWTNSEAQKAELLTRGDLWLAPKFGAWTEQEVRQGYKEKFVVPKEGAIQWMGSLVVVKGIPEQEAAVTQRFFNEWYTKEFQTKLVTEGFFIPARDDLEIPTAVKTSPAVMTATEASQKLIRYDVRTVAQTQREYTSLIQRTLKG